MRRIQFFVAMMATLATALPQTAYAARDQSPAGAPRAAVQDIQLADAGYFTGQVVTSSGTPVSGLQLELRQGAETVASTVSDANGAFQFGGVPGGVYELGYGRQGRVLRVWSAQAAPPVAQQQLLIVADEDVVRGKVGEKLWGTPRRKLMWALLISGGVAAGVIAATADDGS